MNMRHQDKPNMRYVRYRFIEATALKRALSSALFMSTGVCHKKAGALSQTIIAAIYSTQDNLLYMYMYVSIYIHICIHTYIAKTIRQQCCASIAACYRKSMNLRRAPKFGRQRRD